MFCYNYKNSSNILYGTIYRIKSVSPNNEKAMVKNVHFLILKEECYQFRRNHGHFKKKTKRKLLNILSKSLNIQEEAC